MEISPRINILLSQPGILINDPDLLTKKIISLHNGSPKKLQVVADFDYTLTHCHHNGEKMWSSFGAVEWYPKFSDNFREKLTELHSYYAPIDANPLIGKEKKIPLILEWNRRATELYVLERINKETIQDAVAVSKIKLRGGFKSFIEHLADADVPLLVLSAGLGDTINHIITNAGISYETLFVISNYLSFDDDGYINDFIKPLITTGSKGKVAKAHSEYFDSVTERKNVILLGDRIEDLQMSSCFDGSCENILTIGFLNENVETEKNLYMENYDVVLLGDPDLSWIQMLLDVIA